MSSIGQNVKQDGEEEMLEHKKEVHATSFDKSSLDNPESVECCSNDTNKKIHMMQADGVSLDMSESGDRCKDEEKGNMTIHSVGVDKSESDDYCSDKEAETKPAASSNLDEPKSVYSCNKGDADSQSTGENNRNDPAITQHNTDNSNCIDGPASTADVSTGAIDGTEDSVTTKDITPDGNERTGKNEIKIQIVFKRLCIH